MTGPLFFPVITNVKPLTRIRRERVAPRTAEVAVRAGQQVTPTQVVARYAGDSAYRVVNVSQILDVAPAELDAYLLVHEGSPIKRGMPLLRKTGRFGRARQYLSPADGTLHRVINGRLVLRQTPRVVEVRSMLPGYVINLILGRGAVIETYGALVQGLWGTGKDGYGRLTMVSERPDGELAREQVSADTRNRIIVAGHLVEADALQLAEETGVRGLVVGSLPARTIAAAQAVRFPILVTDGIGAMPMATPIFDLLAQSTDRDAALLSHMDSRRGLRPELIIPLPADRDMDTPAGANTPIAVGKRVRLLRAPRAGMIGQVTAVHARAQLLETGGHAHAASVQLADGTTCLVPFVNLDLIE